MSTDAVPRTEVPRRLIARGAVWSVPVVSVAALAPSVAASPTSCGTCVIPVLSASATTMTRIGGTRTVTMAPGFTFSVTGCTGLLSLQTVTVSSAVLTMSDGTSYTTTAGLGLGPGAAGLLVTVGAITWTGVTIPTGLYAGVAVLGALPIAPTSVCFTVNYVIRLGGAASLACSQVVCFTPNLVSVALGSIPGVVTLATTWL